MNEVLICHVENGSPQLSGGALRYICIEIHLKFPDIFWILCATLTHAVVTNVIYTNSTVTKYNSNNSKL